MKMFLTVRLSGFAGLLLATALVAQATLIQFTWTGRGSGNNWSTANNWQGNTAPSNDGLAQIVFSSAQKNYSVVSADWNIYSLDFSGNQFFGLQAPSDTTKTLTLQNGLTFSPSDSNAFLQLGGARDTGTLNFALAANQTWNLTKGTTVVNDTISGSAALTKSGDGTLRLYGSNTYSGGTTLNAGTIEIGSDSALGTGTLTVAADSGSNSNARPTLRVIEDERTLSNNLVLNGAFRLDGEDNLTLTGAVTLNQSTVFAVNDSLLTLSGAVTGSGSQLTLNSEGALLLKGANTYTGGTVVTQGVLVFGDASAIPATGTLRADAAGYMGFGSGTNYQTDFLNKFDKANTVGSIGVDSEPTAISPTVVSSAVDLTGFGATTRLASATKGTISGTITPQGTNYRFGGGGGLLQVDSALTGARALDLTSPSQTPLTLRLTNTGNTYTGATTVTQSALRFADGALPTLSTGWTMGTGGYIGTEGINSSGSDLTATQTAAITTFIAKFGTGNTTGIVGFDTTTGDSSTRSISGDIILTPFIAANPSIYLGTASNALLSGNITLPVNQNTYRFAAFKGATLEVQSPLTGARNVVIGMADSQATIGDRFNGKYSTVTLSGISNTYTGGTTLYPGALKVGGTADTTTSALGTGTLTIAPTTLDFGDDAPRPTLGVTASNLTIPNAIALNTNLTLGGSNAFTLSGAISGTGGLELGDDSNNSRTSTTVSLSGNNTFSGGTRINIFDNLTTTLKVLSDSGLGTGKLSFNEASGRNTSGTAKIEFGSTAPVLYGLGNNANNSELEIELTNTNNAQLRIIQNSDANYRGSLRADNGSTGNQGLFIKEGTGSLHLNDTYVYGYGQGASSTIMEVKQGTLILSNVTFESPSTAIKLNGGTLALDNNQSLSNPLTLTSGTLAGNGTFTNHSPIPTIGSGLILSPGISSQGNIGKLNFYELNLAAGGTYEWNLQTSGNASSASFDQIDISLPSTLSLNGIDLIANPTASASTRFTLKAISLQSDGTPGTATGFTSLQSYSWTIFSFNSIAGFDANKFIIDASQFSTNFGSGLGAGTFSITQDGNTLKLNFTSVPEPSTYALLALGLGFIALTIRRQVRQRV